MNQDLNKTKHSADPPRMDFDSMLHTAVDRGASDIHLKVGQPPVIRHDGHLQPLEGWPALTTGHLEATLKEVGAASPARLAAFEETGELDLAYQRPGLPRFRVNAFRQRGEISFALRVIPSEVPNFGTLRLPPGVERLAEEHRGLVLVTGATGSGKTTTLASIIGHMNRSRRQHIVTIEDPIEILHADDGCIVNQREVGLDTASFHEALRRVLRQDPDIILIGELRDAETAETALQAAESGHLVLSTMHTVDASETVGRLVEFFPAIKQPQVRVDPRRRAQGRRQPAPAPAGRRRTRRGGRGDDLEQPNRRADSREQARVHFRGDRGRHVLRHADALDCTDRPRPQRRRRSRDGGECRAQPPRFHDRARSRSQGTGGGRRSQPRSKSVEASSAAPVLMIRPDQHRCGSRDRAGGEIRRRLVGKTASRSSEYWSCRNSRRRHHCHDNALRVRVHLSHRSAEPGSGATGGTDRARRPSTEIRCARS